MARQRPVDESGVTDCVSSLLFVLLSCSLCCLIVFLWSFSSLLVAVLFQFGCCRSVALLFVLLFSIVLCCRFILRCCVHGIIILRASALVFRLALCAWFVERRL